MSFSLKKIKQLESITAQDSLDILIPDYARLKDKFIVDYNRQVKINSNQLEILEDNVLAYQTKPDYKKTYTKAERDERINEFNLLIENTKSKIADLTDQVEKVKNDSINSIDDFEKRAGDELIELRNMGDRIQSYKTKPELVLANTCKVTYKIKNPLMNNVKQEITKTLVFSADYKKVLTEVFD